ncbi:pentatricopeptide repeat-containing protein At1g63130, mitochondrial-like [Pistacia vera]|uniref:pentatricopeptide repeat-containing protein At1g63130, mitochondrial-like n=1 Tax=Pistacia vera TaxID=55513 RepID=UPI001263899A|nr:pentatricopeptide repeat-containing protein At1g63130, mitochondrial-like [Pistacia vera]
MELFKQMVAVGCRANVITCSNLIGGLCKIGKISVAIKLLEEMVNGNKEYGVICRPGVVVYTTIIDGLYKIGDAKELFDSITRKGYTSNIVKDAWNLVGEMRLNDVFPDSWTYNIFIGLWRFETAWDLFHKFSLHGNLVPDVVTYSILINGLCKNGQLEMEKQNPAKVHPTAQMLYIGYGKEKVQ